MNNHNVIYLNTRDTKNFTKGVKDWMTIKKFIGLDIYGKKSAYLLANVIDNCFKRARGLVGKTIGSKFFLEGGSSIAINSNDEIGILFSRYNTISKLRNARGDFERLKTIKDMLANEIQMYWKERAVPGKEIEIHATLVKNNNNEKVVDRVSWSEYGLLYEVLKSSDLKKIEKKYDTKVKDSMIGQKIEDQFILTALEMLDAEFDKICREEDEGRKAMKKIHADEYYEIRARWEDEKKSGIITAWDNAEYAEYTEMRHRQEKETKAFILKYKNEKERIDQQKEMIKNGLFAV